MLNTQSNNTTQDKLDKINPELLINATLQDIDAVSLNKCLEEYFFAWITDEDCSMMDEMHRKNGVYAYKVMKELFNGIQNIENFNKIK